MGGRIMISTTTAGYTNHTPNISAATCTTAKNCSGCGYVYQFALGHDWYVHFERILN